MIMSGMENVSDARTQKTLNDQLAQADKDAETKKQQKALEGFEQAVKGWQ
jgi:hypothetical protein